MPPLTMMPSSLTNDSVSSFDYPECVCDEVGATALDRVRRFSLLSYDADDIDEHERSARRLSMSDLDIGDALGSGAFNEVIEVRLKCDKGCGKRYAMKRLRKETAEELEKFRTGATDLALEGELLSSLRHKNIINLEGVSDQCISKAFRKSTGYFLILERLEMTLSKRIHQWHEEERQYRKGILPLKSPHLCQTKCRDLLMGRLQAAVDIAKGLDFLHQNNIIYRDLKPQNIGFDHKGNAKIFDFGMAKEIHPEDEEENRRFTGLAGTFRYMAPEVAKCKNYGLSADVFSFGILLWQMCKLRTPFEKYSRKDLQEKVVYGDSRPKIDSSWPASVAGTMQMCWSADQEDRPCLGMVVTFLNNAMESSVKSRDQKRSRRSKTLSSYSSQASAFVGKFRNEHRKGESHEQDRKGEIDRRALMKSRSFSDKDRTIGAQIELMNQFSDTESDEEEAVPTCSPQHQMAHTHKLSRGFSFRGKGKITIRPNEEQTRRNSLEERRDSGGSASPRPALHKRLSSVW